MKNQKNERGITLVALVVTIVVLLILAGITIMYVMSDNGIFGQAQQAGEKSDTAAVEEAVSTALSTLYVEVYTKTSETGTLDLTSTFTANMPSVMPEVTPGSCSVTATPGQINTLTVNNLQVKYKGKTYNVAYSKDNTTTGTAGVTATVVGGATN